jgi:hypothetical protein
LISQRENVDRLVNSGKVAGILLPVDGAPPSSGFSPDERFPQQRFGLHKDVDYSWNLFVNVPHFVF